MRRFKAGDTVVVVDDSMKSGYSKNWFKESGLKIGDICIVKRDQSAEDAWIHLVGENYTLDPSHFQLLEVEIEEEEDLITMVDNLDKLIARKERKDKNGI